MKCVVCEGKYDRIFLQEYIRKYSNVRGYPVKNNMDDFFAIFRSEHHPYHGEYGCVIYSEGGKSKLFERVVIPCVQEVFGKDEFVHHFFVVADADGADPEYLCGTYCEAIERNIRSRNITRYSCRCQDNDPCFIFFSPRDERYRCVVKATHLPMSLERELVREGLERFRSKIPGGVRRNILDMPVHDALRFLSDRVKLSVEDLIRLSVNEEWFTGEPWLTDIGRGFHSVLGIDLQVE